MLLRKVSQNSTLVMRLGLLFLIAATLSVRFLHRIPHMPENLADGLTGAFYGLAIGLLLLSLRLRRG
jgi:hypothetical protein